MGITIKTRILPSSSANEVQPTKINSVSSKMPQLEKICGFPIKLQSGWVFGNVLYKKNMRATQLGGKNV
jgi:hypothetical protein